MTYICCSYFQFHVLYWQLCELYVSQLSPSGWLVMMYIREGLLLDNCHYDVTEASGKASNMNATIVACRNERVNMPQVWQHFMRKQHASSNFLLCKS